MLSLSACGIKLLTCSVYLSLGALAEATLHARITIRSFSRHYKVLLDAFDKPCHKSIWATYTSFEMGKNIFINLRAWAKCHRNLCSPRSDAYMYSPMRRPSWKYSYIVFGDEFSRHSQWKQRCSSGLSGQTVDMKYNCLYLSGDLFWFFAFCVCFDILLLVS